MTDRAETPLGFHVYGSGAALKFEQGLNEQGKPVLAVDGCNKAGSHFDWGNKIMLQLSDREVPGLLCCVLGLIPEFEARNHGATRNKSVHLVNQPAMQRIYVKLSRPEYAVKVPMTPDAVFKLGGLALQVLSAQTGFDPSTCLALLRGTAGRLYSARPSST